MTKKTDLNSPRMSKDELTDLTARKIIHEEIAAREKKTKRLKAARLKREVDQKTKD